MNYSELCDRLQQNRLLQSPEEITIFEETLSQLIEHPPGNDFLPRLHLTLDDRCQQPEIMFGLVHFLESFDIESQLKAFVTVLPQLIDSAPEWSKILHQRIINDESAYTLYQTILESAELSPEITGLFKNITPQPTCPAIA